jgi:hypothetical protein
MKCLNREIIFDYINKELSEDNMEKAKGHLESCEKCQEVFHHVNIQIQRVKTGLDLLSPENMPELPIFSPQETKKTSKGIISGVFQQPLKISIEFSWLKVCVFALLILIFISIFSFRKDREISENDLQRLLMIDNIYYEEDTKVDWNGKKLVIIIFDEEKDTFELVKTDMHEAETSSVKFKVGEKKPHSDI